MYRTILRRIKKNYPQANGVIFEDTEMEHASAIKFNEDNKNSRICSVDSFEGMYIFLQSNPNSEFQEIGSVKKTGLVWTGKPKEMFRIILKKAKKDYPDADGLIFDDINMDHASVIKFKK